MNLVEPGMFGVYFKGGPNDRWHLWAQRADRDEAYSVYRRLLSIKGAYDAYVEEASDGSGLRTMDGYADSAPA